MPTNQSLFEWFPKDLSVEEAISIYLNIPLCLLGFIMCFTTGFVLSSNEFKEKSFVYIKIESFLKAADLAIVAFRSPMVLYICKSNNCPKNDSLINSIVKVYIFTYLPSPIEASVLVAGIMAVSSRLAKYTPKIRKNFIGKVLYASPNRVMLISFGVFSLLFSYQLVSDPALFYIEFFRKQVRKLSIVTFATRDGLLLAVLVALDIKIWSRCRASMQKKVEMIGANVQQRVRKATNRINLITFFSCLTTIIGRLPFFFYIFVRSIFPRFFIPGIFSICITMIILSYASTFFVFFSANKQFRTKLIKQFSFKKFIFIKK